MYFVESPKHNGAVSFTIAEVIYPGDYAEFHMT